MDAELPGHERFGGGSSALDKEYTILFDLLRRLVRCFKSDDAHLDLPVCVDAGALLDTLYQCSQRIFSCEETLLRDAKHPQLSNHLRNDRMRLAELQLIIKQIKREIRQLDERAIGMLREWFVVNRNCSKQAISQR